MVQGNTLDRLTAMGFIECGEWTVQDSQLAPKLLKYADAPNVLYAFVTWQFALLTCRSNHYTVTPPSFLFRSYRGCKNIFFRV